MSTRTTSRSGALTAHQLADRRAWIVISAFVGAIGILLTLHAGRVLEIAFAPLAVLVGWYALFRAERVYLVFVLSLMNFAPFVHRVADAGGTVTEQSWILAAPLLVALSSALRIRKLPLLNPNATVFLLPVLAILYGTLIGAYGGGVKAVVIPLVSWLCPISIGLFCYLYEDADHSLARSFSAAILLVGVVIAIYGIVQYFAPASWDLDWLTQLQADGQALSMGQPEPLGIRVFSTCNNAQGAGSLLGFAVLVALLQKKLWKLPLLCVLLCALLLTSVRSAWAACAIAGFLLLLRASTKSKLQAMIFSGILLAVGAGLAGTSLGYSLTERFASFGSIKSDTSYLEREQGRNEAASIVMQQPFGLGLGYATTHAASIHFSATDLGVVTMPIELGYMGTLFYAVALGFLIFGPLWKGMRASGSALQVAIGMMFILLLFANTNPLNNGLGMLFWAPAGLLLRRFADREAWAAPTLSQAASI